MMTFDFPEAKGIVVCGDIHGDFDLLVCRCCKELAMTDTLIVVAGDCGFGFEPLHYYEETYERNRELLSESNCWVVMLRGNHDNPAYFSEYRMTYDRFMTVPDYSVLTACGHTILCVGGAISVDRTFRLAHPSYYGPKKAAPLYPDIYWLNENPVFDYNELRKVTKAFTIDTVVTHTAPSFCELILKTDLEAWAVQDRTLLFDVETERKTIDGIYEYLHKTAHQPLKHWFYGHFHKSWQAEIDGTVFQMLGILELKELL